MNRRFPDWKSCLQFCAALALMTAAGMALAEETPPETAWQASLKNRFFQDRPITEGSDVIQIKAPYRAEDAALVPLQVVAQFPQSSERSIRSIMVIIDSNPVPWTGTFQFTPLSGRADVAFRARVNAYSWVRAIAETSDGKLYMNKAFVKASGGCSAPLGADLEAAMARLGKMKFKLDGTEAKTGAVNEVQLLISHPNLSGMQMDQITRMVKPAHFVKSVNVSYDGAAVFGATTDIGISADPNFRFNLVPDHQGGELKAEITDNLDQHYSWKQPLNTP